MKQHSRLLKINGEMYVTMHIPVEFTVEDTLAQSANKHVKHDIELFERLGWKWDEIKCEDREQNYI